MLRGASRIITTCFNHIVLIWIMTIVQARFVFNSELNGESRKIALSILGSSIP